MNFSPSNFVIADHEVGEDGDMPKTLAIVALAMTIFSTAVLACLSDGRGDSEPTLLMLWNLPYGFDQEGECVGGPRSIGWERSQERAFPPEVGFYCTGDPAYIAYAVAQMKSAGVSVVLLTWYGWGSRDLEEDIRDESGNLRAPDFVGVNAAVRTILEHLRDNEPTIKAGILVEPFFLNAKPKILPADLSMIQRQRILDYLRANFYEPFADQIFRWGAENKPLVVNWKNNEGRWPLSDTQDPYFSFREFGVLDDGADWEFTAHLGLDGMKVGTDGAIWIAPRFDETYLWGKGALPADKHPGNLVRLDPHLTEGLYDKAWEKVYENRDRISMVMVYGWNPWAEAAAVEPSTIDGDLLLRKTAWYYQRLREGRDFQPF